MYKSQATKYHLNAEIAFFFLIFTRISYVKYQCCVCFFSASLRSISSYLTPNRFSIVNSIEIFVPLLSIFPRGTKPSSLASFRIFNYHDRCFDIRSEHYLIATRTTLFPRINRYTFQFQKSRADRKSLDFKPWHTRMWPLGSCLSQNRKIDIL